MERISEAEKSIDETSEPYVGQWNRLISSTNWEKGRIIYQWRAALESTGAPASEYSDDAWSRNVGGLTGQHVGRLRRVYERFGKVHEEYEGLYWSHFQAALDWDDAEMWLEGAIQNDWSVSRMRRQRWETLGAVKSQQPREDDVIECEQDEDYVSPDDGDIPAETISPRVQDVRDPGARTAPETDDEGAGRSARRTSRREAGEKGASIYAEPSPQGTVTFVRPFEHLADLPTDLSEAFDSFKLAIIRHKSNGWQEVSRDDVLASLDALKELALAPSTIKQSADTEAF